MDNRPLLAAKAVSLGNGAWRLDVFYSPDEGRVGDGLYLMVPVDDVAQAKQVVLDLMNGMQMRERK